MKKQVIFTESDNNFSHDDHEATMARAELYKAAEYAIKVFHMIEAGDNLEGWVSAKITKAADYLDSVAHYMEYQKKFGQKDQQEEEPEPQMLDFEESVKTEISNNLLEQWEQLKTQGK